MARMDCCGSFCGLKKPSTMASALTCQTTTESTPSLMLRIRNTRWSVSSTKPMAHSARIARRERQQHEACQQCQHECCRNDQVPVHPGHLPEPWLAEARPQYLARAKQIARFPALPEQIQRCLGVTEMVDAFHRQPFELPSGGAKAQPQLLFFTREEVAVGKIPDRVDCSAPVQPAHIEPFGRTCLALEVA